MGGPKPITGPWPTHFQKWVGRSDYTRAPVTAVGGPDRLHPCVFLVLMCRRWAVKIVLVFTRKTSHRRRDPNPRNSLHGIRLSYLYALIDCATLRLRWSKRLKTITEPRQRDLCNQSHRGRPRVFAKRQTYFNGILFLTLKHTLKMCRYCRNL